MTLIHRKCGTKLVSSGKGDFGVCPKCDVDVHHLVLKKGELEFSKEVIVK